MSINTGLSEKQKPVEVEPVGEIVHIKRIDKGDQTDKLGELDAHPLNRRSKRSFHYGRRK